MKYFKTAIVLCLICGICAILIAGVNMFTSGKIEENKVKTAQKACEDIYPNCEYVETNANTDNASINKVWAVKENGNVKGYIYSLSGKNAYGNISLLVGVNLDGSIEKVVLTENTQSFASKVKKHVLSTYNGEAKVANIDTVDVSCGATFGATTVKELIQVAVSDFNGGNN